MRIHHRVAHHLAGVRANATPTKAFVTLGVTLAALLVVTGLEGPAVVVSALTNLIWIWE